MTRAKKTPPTSNSSRWIIYGVGGVLALLLIVFIIVLVSQPTEGTNLTDLATEQAQLVEERNAQATAEAQALLSLGDEIAGLEVTEGVIGRNHDAALRIPFEANPPTGGTHNPIWQNCDVYDKPIRPEHAVHALEHGAVWITYQEELPESEVNQLARKTRNSGFAMLSPYPNLDSPITLTAWGFQLDVDSADDERIDQFLQKFIRGPQTPERGAACTGGTSDTDPNY
jgi:hypothetical protein